MPLPALQILERKIERQIRLLELRRGLLERKIERHIENHKKRFGQKIENHKKRFESHIRRFEEKNGIRIDDEVRFFRSWIEKPLAIGAVTPSGKALARTMAAYVDPARPGPIIELGPGTGPVTEALVAQGVDPARLVLVEFNPAFCRVLRQRYPAATVVQGDAYGLHRLLATLVREPAAAVVSGLPLFTKPLKVRLRLLYEAFSLMMPGAPFVQFTYAAYSPIPKRLDRVQSEASERIWNNIPPARVWVYRKHWRRTAEDRRRKSDYSVLRRPSSVIQIMAAPKILVIPGSLRSRSHNARLAALAAKEFMQADADVTRISLADYPLPLFDADLSAKDGPPFNALKLKQLVSAHRGVFFASPEYNASFTPLLKNAIDWVSVVRERGEPQLAAYQNRAFAIGGASPGRSGAMQSCLALRQVLAVGCRALVIPQQVTVPFAADAFDEEDQLKDQRLAEQLRTVVRQLIDYARMLGND